MRISVVSIDFMYTLIIGQSNSPSFNKAIEVSKLVGGTFDGEKITLTIKEEMKAYQILFPLFRLNVLRWKNTRAYYKGKKVDPYRFMFLMDQKRKTFYAEVLEQINDDLHLIDAAQPFLYNKREGNLFYFTGETKSFKLVLKGKVLYEFVDKYDVGDIVYFE